MPQWLEERPEVSEKAKKLYAYLTYFAEVMRGRPSIISRKSSTFLAGMSSLVRSFPRTGLLPSPTWTTQQKAIARIITDFFGIRGCRPPRMVISAW